MKKFLSLILVAGLILSCTACEKNNREIGDVSATPKGTEVIETTNSPEPSMSSESPNQTEKDLVELKGADGLAYQEFEHLKNSYNEPTVNFTIDGPAYQIIQDKGGMLWNINDKQLIAVNIDYDNVEFKSIEDIVPAMKTRIVRTCDSRTAGDIEDISIDGDILTINEREVYRFDGTFKVKANDGTIPDKFIVGYTFVIKDTACFVIGVASGNQQLQDDIDEVTKTVDDMIKTLRVND